MENQEIIIEAPKLTVVIETSSLKQEFTLSEDIFNSFEEASEALKQFIQSYRS